MSALAVTLLLPVGTRSLAYQSPVPQSERAGTDEPKVTADEERNSYEIYSMLLRTEMPSEWKITAWAITQKTQTFPVFGSSHDDHMRQCLSVSQEQKSIYLPLIQDYLAKNQRKIELERKFDLPEYSLVGLGQIPGVSVTFEVSAVGFNKDRTRSLVYVGHHCGNLCGGGGYHLLVKKDGKWQVDQEYRGMSCLWAS
jgi:hypothetical protein